jgi:hypothetical protein
VGFTAADLDVIQCILVDISGICKVIRLAGMFAVAATLKQTEPLIELI